jgi:hypothetical protein
MTRRRASHRRGASLIEFALVGIPVIFLLISVFEMSRGMWMYHTLAAVVREGTRFAAVHGNNCNLTPSNCATRVRDVAQRIQQFSVGIPATDITNVRFATSTRAVTCPTLASCLSAGALGDTYWPAAAPGAAYDPGGEALWSWVEVSAQYTFRSAIAMFWPGAGRSQGFGTFVFPASSREMIQY